MGYDGETPFDDYTTTNCTQSSCQSFGWTLKRNFSLTLIATRAIKQPKQTEMKQKEFHAVIVVGFFAEKSSFWYTNKQNEKKLASFRVEFISRGVSGNLIIQLT